MDTILTRVNKGNDFLWSFLLLILLCGTGIYHPGKKIWRGLQACVWTFQPERRKT